MKPRRLRPAWQRRRCARSLMRMYRPWRSALASRAVLRATFKRFERRMPPLR